MLEANFTPQLSSSKGACGQDFKVLREDSDNQGAVRFAVVCPDPARVLAPSPLRHVPCSAMLQLADGSVWHLRTPGYIWSVDRFQAAGELLLAKVECGKPTPELSAHLAYELGIPGVSVLAPNLHRADPDLWQTRKIAVAFHLRNVARPGHSPSARDLEAQVKELENQIRSEVETALGRFLARTDPGALSLAMRGDFDAGLYNYLARPQHLVARQQFAVGFPALLRAAASGEPGSLGAKIRAAVDARVPLVRFLAKELGVSQSAVRALIRQPIEHVGTGWETDLGALMSVLDILRPEDRPRDEKTWLRFNRLLDTASRIFGRRVWHSPLTLAWVREAARPQASGGSERHHDQGFIANHQELLEEVAILRRAIIDVMQDSIRENTEADGSEHTERTETTVDRYLAVMPIGRLRRLSERYRYSLNRARAELDVDAAFIQREESRPLLPTGLTSLDGSRRVISLITRDALQKHGVALDNCLAKSNLDQYFSACQLGRSFLLAVLDARSGEALSTAELRVGRNSLSPIPRLTIVQHTARKNGTPSAACRRAIAETLALFEAPTYQRHLQIAIAEMAKRNANRFTSRVEINLAPVRLAIQQTLGAEALQSLAGHLFKGKRRAPVLRCYTTRNRTAVTGGVPSQGTQTTFTLPDFLNRQP